MPLVLIDDDSKISTSRMETIILKFTCPCNMEVYSFEVLHQLFNSTQMYEDYFPMLRGDAYQVGNVAFGYQELTVRNCIIILEVELRILYELLTMKLLTRNECLDRCQSNKITMSNAEIVLRLSNYWRDKCIEKASLAKGSTEYWMLLNDKETNDDIEDLLEEQMYKNSPHIIDNSSKILNGSGKLDTIYKTSSMKQEISNTCISCNTIISPRCYICDLTDNHLSSSEILEPARGYSCHRYAVNSGLFSDYYLFKIEVINKGTQLNRLKNSLKGVLVTKEGQVLNSTICQNTNFRRMYLGKSYILLDADLLEAKPAKLPNWTMETLNRHKKTAKKSRKRRRQFQQQQQQQEEDEDDDEMIMRGEQTKHQRIVKRQDDFITTNLDLTDLTNMIFAHQEQ